MHAPAPPRELDLAAPLPSLTRLQAALRDYLRAHSGETVTREQLSAAVWGMNYFDRSRAIDQTVSVVRKHLSRQESIVTIFGLGYRHEVAPKR